MPHNNETTLAFDMFALEQCRCSAMLNNDLNALDELLDAGLYFCHATGAIDDKAAYLAKMSRGSIVYRSIEWSDQVVDVLDNVALVTGRMVSAVEVEGVAKQLDNRVLAVWINRDGNWRLRGFQTTPLPKV